MQPNTAKMWLKPQPLMPVVVMPVTTPPLHDHSVVRDAGTGEQGVCDATTGLGKDNLLQTCGLLREMRIQHSKLGVSSLQRGLELWFHF